MSIFKELLDDLRNNDPKTIELIHDISALVEKKKSNKEANEKLKDEHFVVKEEFIYGYNVLYQYRQKKEIELTKTNEELVHTYTEARVIHITQPLNNKEISDANIEELIMNKIYEVLEK